MNSGDWASIIAGGSLIACVVGLFYQVWQIKRLDRRIAESEAGEARHVAPGE